MRKYLLWLSMQSQEPVQKLASVVASRLLKVHGQSLCSIHSKTAASGGVHTVLLVLRPLSTFLGNRPAWQAAACQVCVALKYQDVGCRWPCPRVVGGAKCRWWDCQQQKIEYLPMNLFANSH